MLQSILSQSKCLRTSYINSTSKNISSRPNIWTNSRLFSSNDDQKSGKQMVITKIDPNIPSVANLILNRCLAITQELSRIEKDHPKVQSLVMSSCNPKVFSAGLDITELYNPNPKRLSEFWKSFQQVFVNLYTSKFVTIAALEGTAVAGGCMLAMSCDYRIMSSSTISSVEGGKKKSSCGIGLNETKLGIAAPKWMAELMVRTIGFRKAEQALALGYMFPPEEALQIGLVDELAPCEDVLDKAHKQAIQWSRIPPQARIASKLSLRQKFIDEFMLTREEDVHIFCSSIQHDSAQSNLGKYIQNLKNGK